MFGKAIGGAGSPSRLPTPGICPRVDSSGRYIVNAFTGKPVLVFGDTAWEIVNELTLTEVRQYLADRQSRGINALIVQYTNPVKYVPESSAPGAKQLGGAFPWLLNTSGGAWTGDFSLHNAAFDSPNDVYFDWIEVVVSEANKYGMMVIGDYMYMGFNFGAADGWWQCIQDPHNTQTVCYNFGKYLGNRLKKYPNHVIDAGTDMFPTPNSADETKFLAMMQGMMDAGCYGLLTGHWKRSSLATNEVNFAAMVPSGRLFQSVYPGIGGTTYGPNTARARNAYSQSPAAPCVIVEDKYEGGSYTRLQIRQQGWWGVLSCIAGRCFGNDTIWTFATGWQSALNSIGMQDWQKVNVFFTALEWWKLVPNGLGSIGTLVTAGGGTAQTLATNPGDNDGNDGYDYVTAAATPDKKLLVAYVPNAHTGSVTIDMTKMGGTTTATWTDPTNLSNVVAIGTFPNTGTQAFTIPGANGAGDSDWILKLTS